MAKVKSMSIAEFMATGRPQPARQIVPRGTYGSTLHSMSGVAMAALIAMQNSGGGGFDGLYPKIMRVFDAGVVLIIVFAGGAWCIGHRGRALEILLGVSCGYILARHAYDIREFLRGI